ncbi:MAG: DUF4238 domain-containing protein [Vicinamibacterales bacterium]
MPRHHTVPEVYLKGFFDPDKVAVRQNVLWLYEENRKIRPRGADAVAAIEGFNLDPENPGKEDAAEKAYQTLEDAATPVLEKLRAGDPRLTEEEKGTFAYFIGFQKFRTTWYRETVNLAAVDEFRHTCRRLLDEKRVHEIVGTTEAERYGRVKFSLEDAEKFVTDMADGTIGLTQHSNGWALVGALEAGQKLTPMLARIHWTLCEAPASEPWITSDNPVALFEPFPVQRKGELYGPSLQFLFPISPRFLLFGEPVTRRQDDRGRVSAETVRMMTDDLLRIAHRQVYASFFSKELQSRVNQVFKEREPLMVPMPAGYQL